MNQIDRIMELADQYHEDAAEDIRMCYDQIPSQRSENTRQALRDAIELALTPAEPYGWWVEAHSTEKNKFFIDETLAREYLKANSDGDWYMAPLFTRPQPRIVGLTEDERHIIARTYFSSEWLVRCAHGVAQDIEAKLLEKNGVSK